MGQQPDQQPPDLSAPSKGNGADVVPPSSPPSHPPAFEEVVIHPSPQDARRMTAQGRDRLMRPNASSRNGSHQGSPRPKRRVWSTVEEFPRQQPQPPSSKSSQPPSQRLSQPPSQPVPPPPAVPVEPTSSEPVSSAPTVKASTPSHVPTSAAPSSGGQPPSPSAPAPSPKNSKTPYSDKTQRIVAWSNLLRSLQPFIWAAVILVVVVPLVGKALLFYSSTTPVQQAVKPLTEVMVPAIPRKGNMDKALLEAVQTAHESAQAFAQDELDDWEIQLEGRVDHFLDWYFGYLNQKKMEFMTPLVWVSSAAIHSVNPKHMKANEAVMTRFTGEFQKQFAKQVLVPQTAQMRLENLTTETVNHYLLALRQNMEQVQVKYRIPQGQWDRYLSDISTTIQDTEGNLSNLSLKMLVGGSGYLLTKPLVLATVTKIGTKVSSKMAGTAAAKLAAKTGGTVAAELGTSLVDPIVGVGIFIWDIWDYQHTVDLERPLLKANLLDYLQGVERSLLNDPETGVLSAIAQLEQGIFQAL